jgi:hypothetical protein
MPQFCPAHIRTTPAGSKVFAEQLEPRELRVVESSLKVNGPCVWVFCDSAEGLPEHGIQLNLEEVKVVVDGLLRFIIDAKAQAAEKATR